MRTAQIAGYIAAFCLLAGGNAMSQSLDPTPYCPGTTTAPDGDGWGWENGASCVVIQSTANPVICPTTDAGTDPEDDGWGWSHSIGSCLVDNTSVDKITITDAAGTDISNSGYPLKHSYVKSFGTFAFTVLTATDGTVYQFRVPDAALAATDKTGKTLWLQKRNNYIELQALSDDDTKIYAIVYDDDIYLGAIDAANGEILQRIVDAESIVDLFFGSKAIIALHQVDSVDGIDAVTSLNYDGTVRWKLEAARSLNLAYLGKDGKVYIKEQSGLYGNEQTLILEQ
jgi:hypothetical protein